MFDPDRFIADCRSASVASKMSGVLEVVSAAVSVRAQIFHALGEPRRAGVGCGLSSASTRAARTTSFGGGQRAIPVAGSRPRDPNHSTGGPATLRRIVPSRKDRYGA